ncbi:hypothetical protein NDS46_29920 (plasmid) [Paenibacillus thiaminolyticus]|uniref:hypothetical protein n=1 Tax=Paenibacillus thiaminolyticus TaxID=49283 RepID=UPI00232FFE0F|nr:hypothetical protein [Paenibacillus thiaminolyticus]WCF11566.1 hypothetical protein NDS46_29920 [Paenibacillus thiaminolyticus]
MKLRVCHFPQISQIPFVVEVEDLRQAKFLSSVLANYDLFQFENKIKPDYANMTILEMWDEQEQDWVAWVDEQSGIDDIDQYFEHLKETTQY